MEQERHQDLIVILLCDNIEGHQICLSYCCQIQWSQSSLELPVTWRSDCHVAVRHKGWYRQESLRNKPGEQSSSLDQTKKVSLPRCYEPLPKARAGLEGIVLLLLNLQTRMCWKGYFRQGHHELVLKRCPMIPTLEPVASMEYISAKAYHLVCNYTV